MRKMLLGVVAMAVTVAIGCRPEEVDNGGSVTTNVPPANVVQGDFGGYSLEYKSGAAKLIYDIRNTYAEILLTDVDDACGLGSRNAWKPSQTKLWLSLGREGGNDIKHTYAITDNGDDFVFPVGGAHAAIIKHVDTCPKTINESELSGLLAIWQATSGSIKILNTTATTVSGEFDLVFARANIGNNQLSGSYHITGHFQSPRCDSADLFSGSDRCER